MMKLAVKIEMRKSMRIIDFEEKHKSTYFNCLEEWSDEMKEAGNHKETWYEKVKDKGLRVKLAEDDNGQICGMIQYLPAELAFVAGGEGYYLIKCIWVHGYKEGVGNQQNKGIGSMMLESAEDDCKALNLKGLLAWGVSMPFWMRASYYKKHGYKKIDKDGSTVLLVKSFIKEDSIPQLVRMKKKPPKGEEKVNVMIFLNGWCPAQNIVVERTLRAIENFSDYVEVEILDTTDRSVLDTWGIYTGVFVNGKTVQKGPPPSYAKISRLIEKEVKHCMKFKRKGNKNI